MPSKPLVSMNLKEKFDTFYQENQLDFSPEKIQAQLLATNTTIAFKSDDYTPVDSPHATQRQKFDILKKITPIKHQIQTKANNQSVKEINGDAARETKRIQIKLDQ